MEPISEADITHKAPQCGQEDCDCGHTYRTLVRALKKLVPMCSWCGGRGTSPNEIAGIGEREQCRYCGPAQRVLKALKEAKS